MAVESHRRAFGSMKQAFTILFLFVVINAAYGDLIQKPENTVVTINSLTTLECRSSENGRLQWDSFRNNSQKDELWNGYSLNPKVCGCPCCAINGSEPGKLNITARRETAKRYMCTEIETQTEASAYLVVIESALNCTHNKTDKDVTLSCAIGFYGEWAPKIKWSRSDGGQVEEANVSVKDGQVTSILTMPLTTCKVNYTSSVYFNVSDRPAGVTARNVPIYEDEWQSPSFNIPVIGENESPPVQSNESSGNAVAIGLGTGFAFGAFGPFGAGAYVAHKKWKSRAEQKDGSYPGLQMREQ